MIERRCPQRAPCFVADVYRPELKSETEIEKWRALHTWVKESDVTIIVCKTFYEVDKFIDSGCQCDKPGYHYKFWFETNIDRMLFLHEYNKIFHVDLCEKDCCVYEECWEKLGWR